jgi:predicted transcriptional regulator
MLEYILTPDQLENYFSTLQESCMLVYEQEKQSYKTTDKGMHFLEIYNEVEELVTPKGV